MMTDQQSPGESQEESNEGDNAENTQGQVGEQGSNAGSKEEAGSTETAEQVAEREETKKQSRFQRAQARHEAEVKMLQEKLEKLEKIALHGNVGGKTQQTQVEDDLGPDIKDYEGRNIAEYIADREKFVAERTEKKARAAAVQELQLEKARAALDSKVREARKDLTDWEDVMKEAGDRNIPVGPDMSSFIAESDIGPRIAYHLAKNPELHEKLNKMSPYRMVAELGKLEDKLTGGGSKVEEKKTTSAPAKLTDTKGKASVTTLDPAAAARQGYAAWKAADDARQAAKQAIVGKRK